MARRQVIALGGGGFSMEPHNPLLDLYVLKQVEKPRPKVCFVPTAAGDSQDYINRFYRSFRRYDCEPTHLSLFRGHTAEIEKFILEQDIFYVGGGNTRNLLTLWRDWGVDRFLRRAYENGAVLAGISAGSLCWFEQGVTDSVPGRLSSLPCLGWLKGSNCPHYDGEKERRPSYHRLMKNGEIGPGLATDDGVAAHFIDEKLSGFVSSHPEKRAYRVETRDGAIVETEIQPAYLGGAALLIRRAAVAEAPEIHRAHMTSIREICSQQHRSDEIQGWGNRPYIESQRVGSIKNDRVWVVEDRGSIEGYAHLQIMEKDSEKVGYVAGLYLTPRVSGRGLGRAILELMFEEARAEKVKALNLESSLSAHRFYQQAGFQDTGPEKTVPVNGSQVRCYPMQIILNYE